MTAADVLVQARAAGVEVLIYDGQLASRGPATPELRGAIRAHKPALVALLTGKPEPQRWPELPPLPVGDEHDRWLRGEISLAPFCGHCRRSVGASQLRDIGHGVKLHKACGRVVHRAERQAAP